MRADDLFRARGRGGDLVHVERRGIGRQDRLGLADRIEPREDLLLEVHLLEHRLDDDVGVLDVGVVGGAADQEHARIHVLLGDAAARDAALVILADHGEALVQRLRVGLQHAHGNAGVGEVHGDAAAHGAAADDRGRLDGLHGRIGRHVGNLGGLALGEEGVALALGLLGADAFDEELALLLHALVEGEGERVLHALDAARRRDHAAGAPRDALARALEQPLRVLGGNHPVPGARERAALGHDLLGEGDRARGEIALDHGVEQAERLGLHGRDRLAAEDHVERGRDPDHARQALGAAGAGRDAQLDLRLAEPRRGVADPVMAAQGQLEPAAHGDAVDRSHDRLRAVLGRLDHRPQVRVLGRRAELADVGAAGEAAPAPDQHQGLDLGVGRGLFHARDQGRAQRLAERVDRRDGAL